MRGNELNKARMQGTKANAAKNAPRWIESNEQGTIDAKGAARGGNCRASTVSEKKDAPPPCVMWPLPSTDANASDTRAKPS
jgi:hypothetical protein